METHSNADQGLWRELWQRLWHDFLKKWIDFRAYLRQRRIILDHPNLDFPQTSISSPDWKSPLAFAVQGIVVSAALIELALSPMGLIFKPPEMTIFVAEVRENEAYGIPKKIPVGTSVWKTKADQARQDIEALQAGLRSINESSPASTFSGAPPYADRYDSSLFFLRLALAIKMANQDVAKKSYEVEISRITRQLRSFQFFGGIESTAKSLRPIILPLTVLLGALGFGLLCKIERGQGEFAREHGRRIYLYFVSASLFWVLFAFAITGSIVERLDLFFPATFDDAVNELENTLKDIDGKADPWWFLKQRETYVRAWYLLLIAWWYVSVRQTADGLAAPFGASASRFYRGEGKIRKDIIIATVVSNIIVAVGVVTLGIVSVYLAEALERFRI